jgi:hypothetical protein
MSRHRFLTALDAFRDAPPRRYLIVEWLPPMGWCVLHEFIDYHDAYTYRAEHYYDVPGPKTRVMGESEWRRRTIANMRSRAPWIALSQMEAKLATVRAELADERSLGRARLLDTFGQSKHP